MASRIFSSRIIVVAISGTCITNMDQIRKGWTKNPTERGTLQIIWTCLATMFLCVWTAVHPNIQPLSSVRRNITARVLMMLTAVIFPEIIISAAWRQREQVTTLLKGLRDAYELHSDLPNSTEIVPGEGTENGSADQHDRLRLVSTVSSAKSRRGQSDWDSKQTFFAVMGGFSVEIDIPQTGKDNGASRYTLTPAGLRCLALVGNLPVVSTQEVDERNNADNIAKSLTVLQIAWFAIQIVARLAQELPVTLLEVHTIVHVGCAILMYAIWWNKPYNISRSIVLSDEMSKNMASLFVFRQKLSELQQRAHVEYENAQAAYWRDRAIRAAHNILDYEPPPDLPAAPSLNTALDLFISDGNVNLPAPYDPEEQILMKRLAVRASSALASIPSDNARAMMDLDNLEWHGIRQNSENFTLRSIWGSWSSDVGHEMSTAKPIHFVFNLLYGGGHLAAWASKSFPTSVEAWLWRSSAIIIASVWLWGSLWILFWKASRSSSKISRFCEEYLEVVAGPFFSMVIVAFVLARCYLFVEAFASLRSSPGKTYDEIRWASFVPHWS